MAYPRNGLGMSTSTTELPTIDEVALGAFLHDAGKLLQRGLGSKSNLPPPVQEVEREICPVFQGRYTHTHVLFTELLFHKLEKNANGLPGGFRLPFVRDAAVYHHNPSQQKPWTALVTEADRLASGMDRKDLDPATKAAYEEKSGDDFRKIPLKAILSAVNLKKGNGPTAFVVPAAASADTIVPGPAPAGSSVESAYQKTADQFLADVAKLVEYPDQHRDMVHESFIGLAERYWWGVPSSTVDEPDVSLLDHSLAVAAFAACLFKHHEARGELGDGAAIRDRSRPKFRLLRGDLSGIQHVLFRLGSEQVKGVNRILRARSFLMGQLVEAAGLLIRRRLGLPPYVVLMRAGGQLTMLLPELPDIEAEMEAIQREIDAWMATRYVGELSLNLGLTEALTPTAFLQPDPIRPAQENIRTTLERLRAVTEAAKERPLETFLRSNGVVLKDDYEAGADGYCPACGVRPRKRAYTEDGVARCWACHHEYGLGRKLPKLKQLLWLDGPGDDQTLDLFGAVRLRAVVDDERAFEPKPNVVSGWRPWGVDESEVTWPVATRPIANYVPTFEEQDVRDAPNKYRGIEERDRLSEEPIAIGEIKTMAHIAAEAREPLPDSRWIGRPLLAVLKADVDNLGRIFGEGLGEKRSIGRLVALSRALDWYFTGRLPHLLATRWPDTYTVYAGGDDLLLIGPWRQMLELAGALRADFGCYCGGNPSLTLSAGIAFVSPREPLNRSADAAEAALEAAKARPEKDALGIMGEVLPWTDETCGLPWLLCWSEWLCKQLRADAAKTSFAYKLLSFLELKAKAERKHNPDTGAAIWRARYHYFLARAYPPKPGGPFPTIWSDFHALMGLNGKSGGPAPPSKLAIAFALWRNR